jgi:chemotaxis protein methyltransferase CheR
MNSSLFAFAARLLKERAALVLEPGKEYLLEARLAPVAKRHGLSTAEEYLDHIQKSPSEAHISEIIEAMVTTETMFFRDIIPFETLRKTVLPELIQARKESRQLSIWCAASSSGQEPYTIALILKEYFPELTNWTIKLLATDISHEMLQRCKNGLYSQFEVNRGMPTPLLMKHFQQVGTSWQISESIRRMVDFQPLNLATNWSSFPKCDLIFLRNVMIYFDVETKKGILRRVADRLTPNGYLVLGGAETTFHLVDFFERIENWKHGFYRVKRD